MLGQTSKSSHRGSNARHATQWGRSLMKATKIRKTRLQRGTQQAAKLGPSGTAGGLMDAVLSAAGSSLTAARMMDTQKNRGRQRRFAQCAERKFRRDK